MMLTLPLVVHLLFCFVRLIVYGLLCGAILLVFNSGELLMLINSLLIWNAVLVCFFSGF